MTLITIRPQSQNVQLTECSCVRVHSLLSMYCVSVTKTIQYHIASKCVCVCVTKCKIFIVYNACTHSTIAHVKMCNNSLTNFYKFEGKTKYKMANTIISLKIWKHNNFVFACDFLCDKTILKEKMALLLCQRHSIYGFYAIQYDTVEIVLKQQ